MGGGKSQKGGKHGFIGRTLAHDILARQNKMSEEVRADRPYKQVEQSVIERNNLDEFTMAAQQGLESYLNAYRTTKEVIASDFNSQLERMINYSDVKEFKVFQVVPIPRRCFFFDETHREIIGKLIKQREHENYVKEKKRSKRRNKKLVDLYMQGTGPKPINGMYDQHRTRGKMRHHMMNDSEQTYDDEDSEMLSPQKGGDIANDDDDDAYVNSMDEAELEASDVGSVSDECSEEETDKNEFMPIKNPKGREHTNSNMDNEGDESDEWDDSTDSQEGDQSEKDEDDDWENLDDSSDLNTEEGDEDEFEHLVDDDASSVNIKGSHATECSAASHGTPEAYKPEGVTKSGLTQGSLKYVEEYRASIKQETSNVDIYKLDASELNNVEMRCFYAWRRLLSRIEDMEGLVVTPYEKNIEFWRQLWRVIERSHIVLIILDARDPLFYRVPDLEVYIKEVDSRKETMFILNKADYLSLELRKEWATYFKEMDLDFVFFSTIWGSASGTDSKPEEAKEDICYRIYSVDMLINKIHEYRNKQSEVFPELKNHDHPENPIYTVGFVGYPNVGKSSLINCFMEVTKTNVSCQPGKTKHFQTLALKKANITLCDCPGLIFPNIVSTKHHLLVNSIVSTSHFRGSLLFAVQLICNRIPKQLCQRYDVNLAECVIVGKEKRRILFSQKFLECICHSRKFFSGGKGGQPDIGRAAKLVIKDYINGDLLYCAWPPTSKHFVVDEIFFGDDDEEMKLASELAKLKINGKEKVKVDSEVKTPHEMKLAEERMQQWLMDKTDDQPLAKEKHMTKRKMRFLIKGKRKQNSNKVDNPYG
ncbi:ras GTPase GNL1-like protein [Babesia gibsoni]|uniref:Ras GTPase GNL1-like protein n=1 Tax=Babesia gibsoni TaxID=33632 RepID=A0AAD8PDV1_BABGI|nr:ras GTPase GNL1-like protein [Babesia gibsoni]